MTIPPPNSSCISDYRPGCYLVVSPFIGECAGEFQLTGTYMVTGWPNDLVGYIKAHPDEYDISFYELIMRIHRQKNLLYPINFNMIQFRASKDHPWRAGALYGPLEAPPNPEFLLSVDTTPHEWRHLSQIF